MVRALEFIDPSDQDGIFGDKKLLNFEYIYNAQLNRILTLISTGSLLRENVLQIKRSILALDMALKPYWDNDYTNNRNALMKNIEETNIYMEKDDYFNIIMEWLAQVTNLLDRLNLGLKRTIREEI